MVFLCIRRNFALIKSSYSQLDTKKHFIQSFLRTPCMRPTPFSSWKSIGKLTYQFSSFTTCQSKVNNTTQIYIRNSNQLPKLKNRREKFFSMNYNFNSRKNFHKAFNQNLHQIRLHKPTDWWKLLVQSSKRMITAKEFPFWK